MALFLYWYWYLLAHAFSTERNILGDEKVTLLFMIIGIMLVLLQSMIILFSGVMFFIVLFGVKSYFEKNQKGDFAFTIFLILIAIVSVLSF